MDCDSDVGADCRHRLDWMMDKPPFVALMASAAVLAAEECHALLQVRLREQPFAIILRPQSVQEWLRLYTDHRAVGKSLVEVFSETLLAGLQGSDDEIAAFL